MKKMLVLSFVVSALAFAADKMKYDQMPDDVWADGVLKEEVAYSIQAAIYEKRREDLNQLKASMVGTEQKQNDSYKRTREMFKSNGGTEAAFNEMMETLGQEPTARNTDAGMAFAIRDCAMDLVTNAEMLPAERANMLIRLDKTVHAQTGLKDFAGMNEVYGNISNMLAWGLKHWKPKDKDARELFFATYVDLASKSATLSKGARRNASNETTGDVENFRETWQGILKSNIGMTDYDIATKAWTKYYSQNDALAKSLCNKHIVPDLTDSNGFRMDVLKTFMTPFYEDAKSKQSEMVLETLKKMLKANKKLLDDASIRKVAKDNSTFHEWLFQNVIKG